MGDPEVRGDGKQLFCPQCKEWHPTNHFNALPLDLRCAKCIPVEAAMVLYDDKVKLAGEKVCQLLDAAEGGGSLRKLDGMLEGFYEAFGGRNTLCEYTAEWCKDLAMTNKKAQALAFIAKIFSIHAKVEKTKVEEDWNKMTKEEIRAKLTVLLTDVLTKTEMPAAKKIAINKLIGGQE